MILKLTKKRLDIERVLSAEEKIQMIYLAKLKSRSKSKSKLKCSM